MLKEMFALIISYCSQDHQFCYCCCHSPPQRLQKENDRRQLQKMSVMVYLWHVCEKSQKKTRCTLYCNGAWKSLCLGVSETVCRCAEVYRSEPRCCSYDPNKSCMTQTCTILKKTETPSAQMPTGHQTVHWRTI